PSIARTCNTLSVWMRVAAIRWNLWPPAAKSRRTRLILIQQTSASDTHTRQRIVRRFRQAGTARFNAISRPVPRRERLGRAFFTGARTALLRVLPAKLLLGQLDFFHFFLLHFFLLHSFLLHLFLHHGGARQCLLRQPFGLLGCDFEKFFS